MINFYIELHRLKLGLEKQIDSINSMMEKIVNENSSDINFTLNEIIIGKYDLPLEASLYQKILLASSKLKSFSTDDLHRYLAILGVDTNIEKTLITELLSQLIDKNILTSDGTTKNNHISYRYLETTKHI